MNSYELSRSWFDFCFENPEKVKPNHTAIYFFCIEHCNRLGWKQKFGLPTTMTMEAIGIKSYTTYIKTLNEVVSFGFLSMVERSKNQYSSNIIELTKFDKALDKALDKAMIKHATKQGESTLQSIDSIIKHITNKQYNFKQLTKLKSVIDKNLDDKEEYKVYKKFAHLTLTVENFDKLIKEGYNKKQIDDVLLNIENYRKNTNYKSLYLTSLKWLKKDSADLKNKNNGYTQKFQESSRQPQNAAERGNFNLDWDEAERLAKEEANN